MQCNIIKFSRIIFSNNLQQNNIFLKTPTIYVKNVKTFFMRRATSPFLFRSRELHYARKGNTCFLKFTWLPYDPLDLMIFVEGIPRLGQVQQAPRCRVSSIIPVGRLRGRFHTVAFLCLSIQISLIFDGAAEGEEFDRLDRARENAASEMNINKRPAGGKVVQTGQDFCGIDFSFLFLFSCLLANKNLSRMEQA